MEPLDPQLRQLIDDGLPAAMPDSGVQERGLAALLAHVDGPPPPAPAAAPAGSATAGLTKLVIGVVAAGTVATVGWVASRPDPAPAVVQPATPRAAEPEPKSDPPPPAPIETPAAAPAAAPVRTAAPQVSAPRPRKRPAAPEPAASTPADLLRAEADLIARAESALDRGKAREALALCDMHRSKFDAPQLTTERRAIAASAACLVDETDTKAAIAFVRAHPRSALAKKVRDRCGLDPAPEKSTVP